MARKKNKKTRKHKTEFSKICMWAIFINCTLIEAYSMVAMWRFADLSPLYSLIGAVVGESIAYISYCAKSGKENTKGGITYELAISQSEKDAEE